MTYLLTDLNPFVGHQGITLFTSVVVGIVSLLGGVRAVRLAFKRHRQRQWFKRQSSLRAIRAMSWQAFERYTGELFRDKGYSVTQIGGRGKDGGVDLIVHKAARKYVVQCKRYRSKSIGVPIVRELIGAAVENQAHGAIFITVGNFTTDARKFASNLPSSLSLHLIDGTTLISIAKSKSLNPTRDARDRPKVKNGPL